MEKKSKQKYIAPKIEVMVLELERGIATSSANLTVQSHEDISSEWETADTESIVFTWK